jgi:hypothetical protein
LPVTLWAQTPVQIDFGGPITGKVGDSFELKVTTSNLSGLDVQGFGFELIYNSNIVRVDSGNGIQSLATVNTNLIERVTAQKGNLTILSGEITLLTLYMTIMKEEFNEKDIYVSKFQLRDRNDVLIQTNVTLPTNIIFATGDAPTINVQAGSASVGYEEPVFVPISVVNRADLTVGNYSLNVSYNPNDVKYEGFSFAGTLTNPAQTTVSHNEQDSRITITGTGLSNNFVSDSLVVLQFSGTDFKFFENSPVQVIVTSIATQSEINLNPIPSNGSISVRGSLTAPGKQIQFLDTLNNTSIFADSVFSFQFRSFDPYNKGIKYSGINIPVGAVINENTGLFTWTPARNQAGTNVVQIQATNDSLTTSTSSNITVIAVNRPPVFSSVIKDTTIVQGDVLQYQFLAQDPDNDALSYSIITGPTSAVINVQSGLFTWDSSNTDPGSYSLEVVVSDSELTDTTKSVITVLPSNYPPKFVTVLPDTTINENQVLSFTYGAEDTDGDELNYTLLVAPAGATLNNLTGEFTWLAEFGTHLESPYDVKVVVSDGEFQDTTSAVISVQFTNRPPVFTSVIADTTIKQGQTLEFTFGATDPDTNQTLVYSLNNEPTGSAINEQTGVFTWIPGYDISGTILLEVYVSDGIDSVMNVSTIVVEEVELNTVTFTVYMDLIDDFDVQTEKIYIAGDLSIVSNWETPGSNESLVLTRVNENPFYSVSFQIPDADISYKFFTNETGQTSWDNGEWAGDPNRTATVRSDTTLKHIFGIQPGEMLSISEVIRVSAGAPVDFSGRVTTPMFSLSDGTSVYIQDDTAGIRLVLPDNGIVFTAEPGDLIEVSGETVIANNNEVIVSIVNVGINGSASSVLPDPVLIDDKSMWSSTSRLQGMRVTLQDVILTETSNWPVESPSSGFGTLAQSTGIPGSLFVDEFLSIFVARGASEFDGTAKPAGAFNLTGVLGVSENGTQLLPFYSNELTTATSTDDDIEFELPAQMELYQNYPNPFNPVTTIKYEIAEQSFVRLEVFNIMGQHMITLADSEMTPGSYQVQFDGSNMASGTYLVRLQAGNRIRMMKMTLLK